MNYIAWNDRRKDNGGYELRGTADLYLFGLGEPERRNGCLIFNTENFDKSKVFSIQDGEISLGPSEGFQYSVGIFKDNFFSFEASSEIDFSNLSNKFKVRNCSLRKIVEDFCN